MQPPNHAVSLGSLQAASLTVPAAQRSNRINLKCKRSSDHTRTSQPKNCASSGRLPPHPRQAPTRSKGSNEEASHDQRTSPRFLLLFCLGSRHASWCWSWCCSGSCCSCTTSVRVLVGRCLGLGCFDTSCLHLAILVLDTGVESSRSLIRTATEARASTRRLLRRARRMTRTRRASRAPLAPRAERPMPIRNRRRARLFRPMTRLRLSTTTTRRLYSLHDADDAPVSSAAQAGTATRTVPPAVGRDSGFQHLCEEGAPKPPPPPC